MTLCLNKCDWSARAYDVFDVGLLLVGRKRNGVGAKKDEEEAKGWIKRKERRTILARKGYRCFDTSSSDVHRCRVTVSPVSPLGLASAISFLTFVSLLSLFLPVSPSQEDREKEWNGAERREEEEKGLGKVDPSLMPRRTGAWVEF